MTAPMTREERLVMIARILQDFYSGKLSTSQATDAIATLHDVAQAEPITHRWRSFGAHTWIYDPEPEWLEDHKFEVEWEPVYGAPQPLGNAQPSVSPVTAEASTALRPYGTPASPITPGITWEDHLAAEADDAQTH